MRCHCAPTSRRQKLFATCETHRDAPALRRDNACSLIEESRSAHAALQKYGRECDGRRIHSSKQLVRVASNDPQGSRTKHDCLQKKLRGQFRAQHSRSNMLAVMIERRLRKFLPRPRRYFPRVILQKRSEREKQTKAALNLTRSARGCSSA